MKLLYAATGNFIKGQRTQLTAAIAAGSSVSIPVANSAGYNTNDYIVVGTEGFPTAELAQITSVPDATHIVVATLTLAHDQDDPIVTYRYNQRKFYGSVVTGGPYTELTLYGSPADIGVDDPQGTQIEYTGGEGYLYFKSTYWNSTTSIESNIADANEVYANESVRYCGLYDIRKQAGITENAYYNDGMVEAKRKQAENEVNSYILTRYTLPLTNSLAVSEIPFLVTRCTILLAAGYISYEEFGSEGDGVKWLGEARGILNSIQKGMQRLIDSTGVEMSTQQKTQTIRGQEYQHPEDAIWVDGKRF